MNHAIPAPRVAIEAMSGEPGYVVTFSIHGRQSALRGLSMINAFYVAHGLAQGFEILTGHPCPVDFLSDVRQTLADSLAFDPPPEAWP